MKQDNKWLVLNLVSLAFVYPSSKKDDDDN